MQSSGRRRTHTVTRGVTGTRGRKGDFAGAQPARRRRQPAIYLVQRPPPCSRPTPKYPGWLERVTRQREGEGNALPAAAGRGNAASGLGVAGGVTKAALGMKRKGTGEVLDPRRGSGGLVSLTERPAGQFRLESRGRRATGRLSAPFFRYSFISFRFSSSSVPID